VPRDRYDDWSLPKGKLHSGESALAAAIREVQEETGARGIPSRQLGDVQYRVDGVSKTVRFWAMNYRGGEFESSAEVDKFEWLDLDEARRQLSYRGERAILDTALAAPLPTSVVALVRHARAGKRSDWPGPDELRPLESRGRTQARALAELVSLFAPVRLIAADPLRCVQTLEPLAERLGQVIEVEPAFADNTSALDLVLTRDALDTLVASGLTVAVCSQGDTITRLRDARAAKGSTWVLGCRAGAIVSADYYPRT
jgi:8-oxo-(d)GTP phosphatase